MSRRNYSSPVKFLNTIDTIIQWVAWAIMAQVTFLHIHRHQHAALFWGSSIQNCQYLSSIDPMDFSEQKNGVHKWRNYAIVSTRSFSWECSSLFLVPGKQEPMVSKSSVKMTLIKEKNNNNCCEEINDLEKTIITISFGILLTTHQHVTRFYV